MMPLISKISKVAKVSPAVVLVAASLSAAMPAHGGESVGLRIRATIQPAACALLPEVPTRAADTFRVVLECDAGTRVAVSAIDGLTGASVPRFGTRPAEASPPARGIVRQAYDLKVDEGPAHVTITIQYL